MSYCLTKPLAKKFKEKLKDGTLNPSKLVAMTSAERRAMFADIIGAENAKKVNALFESKLLLKNQQKGMITWAKTVSGIKPQVRRDLIARIERLDKVLTPETENAFLEDLASQRLGISVTPEQAEKLFELSKLVENKKASIPSDAPIGSKERLEYGIALTEFKNYAGDLKLEKPTLLDRIKPNNIGDTITELAGAAKGMVATLDNSFFGRQGIKILYNKPLMWSRAFLKSFNDIGKELVGRDAKLPIQADVYSRPNSLNGKYSLAKIDIGIDTEEAYPSLLPEKIPLLGRLFKASETAYSGGALRLRADYADKIIELAEKQGIDTYDKKQMEAIGNLVNSMTGRGNIGRLNVFGKETNVALFSVKFLKSNFDTLTAHLLDKKATAFTKRQSAKNLLRIVASIATILALAKANDDDSVELDPRSTSFARLKIGKNRFDISGGMSSLVTLASRLVPSKHNGEWGIWSKTSTGNFTNLYEPDYGGRTAMDVFWDFWEGKLSPVAGVLRDLWKGEHFGGEKPSPKSIAKNLTVPISIQQLQDMLNDKATTGNSGTMILTAMILEGLGISVSTPFITNWMNSDSKELNQFKEKVGETEFKKANIEYNVIVSEKTDDLTKSQEYKNMSDEDKSKAIAKIKSDAKAKVFKNHNFKYKQ